MTKNHLPAIFSLLLLTQTSLSWGQTVDCAAVRSQLDNGNVTRANQLLGSILHKDPCHSEALALRGRLQAATDNLQGALVDYDKALACKKELPRDSILEIATAYSLAERASDAISLFREYLHDHPDDVEFLHELGLTHLALSQFEEACSTLEQGQKLAPKDLELATDYGSCLIYAEKIEKALTFLKTVSTNNPREPLPLIFLGDAYVVKKEFSEAQKAYDAALTLNANHPLAHYRRGRLHQQMGNYQAAEEDFKHLLNDSEFQAKAIQASLETNMAAGNLELAQKWLKAAQKYEAMSPVKIATYQAEIFRLQGNNGAAKKVLFELVEKKQAPAMAWKVLLAIGEEERDQKLIKQAKQALETLSQRR